MRVRGGFAKSRRRACLERDRPRLEHEMYIEQDGEQTVFFRGFLCSYLGMEIGLPR